MVTKHSERTDRPKRIEIIARGLLQRNGQVLLCRDPRAGYCYLPGGHVEPGEAAAQALARELYEEAGLQEVTVGPCVLVSENWFRQNGKARHELYLVFHVEHATLPNGTPLLLGKPSEKDGPVPAADTPAVRSLEDHIEFVWVEAPALPDIDLRPKSIKAWLMTARQTGGVDGFGLDRPNWLSESNL